MGYKIQYEQTIIKKTFQEKHEKVGISFPIKWICVGCILFAIIFLGNAGCLDFLIPGDNAVTKQAFSSMVDEVSNGESIKTAVTTFCLEILNGSETEN